MKPSITQLYHANLNDEVTKKIAPPVKPQEGVEKFELWSRDAVTEIIVESLKTRREQCLQSAMNLADGNEIALRMFLKEAKTITQTLTLMNTGEYK